MKTGIAVAVLFTAWVLLADCGGHTSAKNAVGGSSPAGVGSALMVKPLRLPKLSPGVACPETPISNVRLPVAAPRGGPHFYLGGPNAHGAFPWNKTVYVLAGGAKAPVLLRGARIDGSGTLKFDGQPAEQHEQGETLTSQGGVTRTFYPAILSAGAIQQDGSTADAFYLYPSSAGCYALQADGDSFEDVVVFLAA